MKEMLLYLFVLSLLIVFACTKGQEDFILDAETQALVSILEEEIYPLPIDPLSWSDEELQFLETLTEKSVVALGEATHGTAEFFKAKHRLFQFLVENHGYRVFAFEADFGESLYINEAIQESKAEEIDALMKSKMHFWTWKTEEVKDLLEWMCNYNLNKPDEEKVHYMGIDCQFNTYHPQMVLDYMALTEAPFYDYAATIIKVARSLSENKFPSFTPEAFDEYVQHLDAIQDSMTFYEDLFIQKSSEKEYQLHARLLRVIRQVSEVIYANKTNDFTTNYRDKYMAENTAWLLNYFGKKIVLWAHNGHISNNNYLNTGTMGYYIYQNLIGNYGTVGFLFSQGTFTAVGMEGEQYTEMAEQSIDTIPQAKSLNAIMYHTKVPAFAVRIGDLMWQSEWLSVLNNGMQFFHMGAVYNNNPEDYYSAFNPDYFDWIIYFDQSTASKPL